MLGVTIRSYNASFKQGMPCNLQQCGLLRNLHREHCKRKAQGVQGSGFAGYLPLRSQNHYPIIVYYVANFRPHLSHFWANVIAISRMEFNASRLLNIKTTAETIFNRESSYF